MSDETYKYRIIVHRLNADGHPTSYFHSFGSGSYSVEQWQRANKATAETLMDDAMNWQVWGLGYNHDFMVMTYGPIIKLDLVEDTPEKASYVIWTRHIYPLLEEVTHGPDD